MKRNLAALLILSALNVLTLPVVLYLSSPAHLEVSFFNVGQGDSIFIKTPQNHQILIDGGPAYSIMDGKLSQEMPFWDKEIDLIVLSHPESDHMTGLLDVLNDYKVDNILWTGEEKDSEKFRTWKNLVEKEGANVYYANTGDKVVAGDVSMDIISPEEELTGQIVKDANDTSVVARLLYKNSSFLFTGDISSKAEKAILADNIDSDVLKVPHHGSKYSSCQEFLDKVSPLISVIQVGKNSYGHPAEEALTRLLNSGIKILRSDTNGDIKIVSDGTNYKIITNKN